MSQDLEHVSRELSRVRGELVMERRYRENAEKSRDTLQQELNRIAAEKKMLETKLEARK